MANQFNNFDNEESNNEQLSERKGGNVGLPFGLCKKYGINLPDKATPRDAWNALEGIGITPEKAYADLKRDEKQKREEAENIYDSDLQNHEDNDKSTDTTKEGERLSFSNRKEALSYAEQELGMQIGDTPSYLPDEVLIPNVEQLAHLDSRYKSIDKSAKIWFSGGNRGGNDTLACTLVRYSNATVGGLNLCERHYGDYSKLVAKEIELRDKGESADFTDNFAPMATITHEYGHILYEKLLSNSDYVSIIERERKLADERSTTGRASSETMNKIYNKIRGQKAKEIFQELTEIARSIDSNVNMTQQMSSYGNTDYEEYFAEAFLNSQGGKPNTVGKAMQIFLDRRFK